MTAASGQYGKIQAGGSTLVECTGWSFTDEVAEHSYASCSTGGYRKRVAGTRDITGTAEGVLDPSDHIRDYVEPGDQVTLNLYYTASLYHSIPAQINQLEESVDVEDGEILRWTINWGLNGTPSFQQS